MPMTTFEGVIENGRVQLPDGVVLPERKVVCVLVPENDNPAPRAHSGFRLENPADAVKFEMTVTRGEESRPLTTTMMTNRPLLSPF